jgi:hypothetical protein
VAVAKLGQLGADLEAAKAELVSVQTGIKDLKAAAQVIISPSHSYFDPVARFAF